MCRSAARLSRRLVLVLGLVSAGLPGADQAAGERFVFQRLNRTYENLAGELAPVRSGAFGLRLWSPRNALEVRSHALVLRAVGRAEHEAELEVEVLGEGLLELAIGEGVPRLEDEVMVPLQRLRLSGRVGLERVDGGYLFTALELPPEVEISIRSRIADQMVELCGRLSFAFGGSPCEGIERSLSSVVIPLPEPGGRYLLPDSQLGADERQALERYLGREADAAEAPIDPVEDP